MTADATELARRWGAPAVHRFGSLGSTNDVARRLAAAGAADGTVVVADEQTAGRGRAGRAWSSPPGLGLWLSIVRRPDPNFFPGPLPLRVGLAAAAALDPILHAARCALKWPNDLLVDDRKLGGILCEAIWEGDRSAAAIVGVGINVLHRRGDLPPELRDTATSVATASGFATSIAAVADALIPALLAVPLAGPLTEAELAAFHERDPLQNREVDVSDPITGEHRLRGTALGPGSDGSLRVRTVDGAEHPVHSGTIRLARSEAGVAGGVR